MTPIPPLRMIAHLASAAAILALAFAFGRWLREPNPGGAAALVMAAVLAGLAMRQLYRRRAPGRGAAGAGTTPADDGRVDINTAPIEDLQRLPGVGPATAGRIVAGRPFASLDELGAVAGFGPAKIRLLEPYIRIS